MNQQVQYLTSLVESGEKKPSFPDNCIDFFPGLVYLLDLDRKEIIAVNKKFSATLGLGDGDTDPGSYPISSIVHPDDHQLLFQGLDSISRLVNGADHVFTARFRSGDGGWQHIRTTGHLVDHSPERGKVAFCVGQNISSLVKIEDDFNALHQLFEETEKLILFGTWSWMPATDQVEWTDGMYELLDYRKEDVPEVTNNFFVKHVVSEHADDLQQAVRRALEEKTGFNLEFVIRTGAGKEKYVQTKGKPILDNDGNIRKILGITRDITLKKNFEKERDRSIRELNRSNKELEEFAYVASHDMHEPLRKILTFSERIKTKYADAFGDDGKVYLERIVASASNMRMLIDNLLEFSRVSRGRREFVSVDVSDVVREVMSDQELRIEETGTSIQLVNLPKVEAVPSELRQLFNNLIGNAIKFRKKDASSEIVISGQRLTHKQKSDLLLPFNQVFFKIDVSDNGIGFDAIYAEKIFEIFQRLHGKAEYSGSGIGLAICKKIVENHGGLIHASGTSGQGATFSIILPEKQYH